MRLEGEVAHRACEKVERMVQTTPARKRKGGGVDKANPGKRRKIASNIRDYISCKKWRLEGTKEERHDKDKNAQGQHQLPQHHGVEGHQQELHHLPQIEGGQAAAATSPPTPTASPSPPGTPRRGESCSNSMHDGMPGPIVQANTGGIAPSELSSKDIETNDFLMRERVNLTRQREMGGEPAEEGQDLHHQQQPDQMPAGGQTSQQGERCHEEEISCGISMHIRMPGPVVQA